MWRLNNRKLYIIKENKLIMEEKIVKIVKINGIAVRLELQKKELKDFPDSIESTIKVKDKELSKISAGSVFL